MFTDAVAVVSLSLFTALLSEALSWFLVHRTDSYKRRRDAIDRLQKKVDKAKEKGSLAASKKKSPDELELARLQQEMARSNMFSMIALSVSYFIVFNFGSSAYTGIRVARLPFVPYGLFQSLSHRGLEGEDLTDCSMTFLFVLSSIGFRANLQKLFGTTPPSNAPSLWTIAQQQQQGQGKW